MIDILKAKNPATKFLLITAYVTVEGAVKAVEKGVADYIIKPFLAEEVLVRIKNLLLNAEQRQATILPADNETEETKPFTELSELDQDWIKTIETKLKEAVLDPHTAITRRPYLGKPSGAPANSPK